MKVTCFLLLMSLNLMADVRSFTVSCDHTNCIYRVGETAAFSVLATDAKGNPATAGTVRYRTHKTLTTPPAFTLSHDLSTGNPFVVRGTLNEPGFLRLDLQSSDGSASAVWGVAFDPQEVRPSTTRPADFDAYWNGEIARLATEVPTSLLKMTKVDARSQGSYDYYEMQFATFKGGVVYAAYTEPKDQTKTYPALVYVEGAGPGGNGTYLGAADRVTLHLNAIPIAPCDNQDDYNAAYANWNAEITAKYGLTVAFYGAAGISVSREEYYFHDVMLGMNRAVDWLASRPLVNVRRVCYFGGSQGGAYGLFLMGLNTHFTRGCAYIPGMCDQFCYANTPSERTGWARVLEANANQLETTRANLPYFDAAFFASRITCPTVRILVGLIDDVCPPRGGWCAYNALPAADKSIESVPGLTHAVDETLKAKMMKWVLGTDPATNVTSDVWIYDDSRRQPTVPASSEGTISGLDARARGFADIAAEDLDKRYWSLMCSNALDVRFGSFGFCLGIR